MLLAFQPEDEIERALAGTLTKLTPKSVTDPDELRKRLLLVRKRGWEFAIRRSRIAELPTDGRGRSPMPSAVSPHPHGAEV